ncbi:unnamed protein product, partial [Nesidiocoris tenuis]
MRACRAATSRTNRKAPSATRRATSQPTRLPASVTLPTSQVHSQTPTMKASARPMNRRMK